MRGRLEAGAGPWPVVDATDLGAFRSALIADDYQAELAAVAEVAKRAAMWS